MGKRAMKAGMARNKAAHKGSKPLGLGTRIGAARRRADTWIAAGTIAIVTGVPTVMVIGSWNETGAAKTQVADPQRPDGSGAAQLDLLPAPGTTTPSGSPSASPTGTLDDSYTWPSTGSGGAPAWSPPPGSGGNGGSGGGDSDPRKRKHYLPATNGARIVATKWRNKREVDLTVKSPALNGTEKVRVLLPKTWRSGSLRAYPIVYAYHGGHDHYTSWTRSTDIEEVAGRYDVIVAMPEGADGSYTDWFNDGKGGIPKWETFHLGEVRQLMELNFRAGSSRAAMGISSGAGGALSYAARFPGLFRYASSYSGIISMLSPGIPSMLMYVNSGNGVDPQKIWGDPVLDRANWKAHDPATLLERLRGTGLYVSAGNGKVGPLDKQNKAPWDVGLLSEQQVYRSTKDFIDRAKGLGVPLTVSLYGDGSHSWPYWKREMHRNWPAIMKAIGARKL